MVKSAGILLYKKTGETYEIFLVHPGGPFWKNKDTGAWTIPKGEFTTEDPLIAALREFKEETSQEISGNFIPLNPAKLKSGKVIFAFAVEGEIDITKISSNLFELEWPPASGKKQLFPEIDKGAWFSVTETRIKINPGQVILIDQLLEIIIL